MEGSQQAFQELFEGDRCGDDRQHGDCQGDEEAYDSAFSEGKCLHVFYVFEAGRDIGQGTEVWIAEQFRDMFVSFVDPFFAKFQRVKMLQGTVLIQALALYAHEQGTD